MINQLVKQSVEKSRKARKSRCPLKLPIISSGEYGTLFALERAAGARELAFPFIGSSSLLTSCDRAYTHDPFSKKPAGRQRCAGSRVKRGGARFMVLFKTSHPAALTPVALLFWQAEAAHIRTASYARSIRLSQVYFSQQCSARQFTISRPAAGGSEYESNMNRI